MEPCYHVPLLEWFQFSCTVFGLVLLKFNVPVNNFSVISGRSHRFLGITSTFWEVNVLYSDGLCGVDSVLFHISIGV